MLASDLSLPLLSATVLLAGACNLVTDFDKYGAEDACVTRSEVCNESDDDCDGTADEDFDLESSLQNCGACAHACQDAVGATPACGAGECRYTCKLNQLDCDDAIGCESSALDPRTCGDSDTSCSGATPTCSRGECIASEECEGAADGNPCVDDGNPCTIDVCASEVCVHRPLAASAAA